MPGKAKPKAKRASRAGPPRKPASRPKAEAKPLAKPPAKAAKKAQSGAAAKRPAGKASASLVEARIQAIGGWRAKTLAEVRRLIHEADPGIVEDIKWVKPSNPLGVPVWSHAGIVCTGEAYKETVKLTFMRGASLADPRGLFNAGFGGGTRRAIDIREGEALDAEAFKALVREAVEQVLESSRARSQP